MAGYREICDSQSSLCFITLFFLLGFTVTFSAHIALVSYMCYCTLCNMQRVYIRLSMHWLPVGSMRGFITVFALANIDHGEHPSPLGAFPAVSVARKSQKPVFNTETQVFADCRAGWKLSWLLISEAVGEGGGGESPCATREPENHWRVTRTPLERTPR